MPPHADEVCLEGAAARFFFDLESPRSCDRDRSPCRQVQEALLLALAEATSDPRLDGAWVSSVDPAPGPELLLVSVVLSQAANAVDAEAVLGALVDMKPWLRSEVARAIHRKHVPELAFRVVLEGKVARG